MALNQVVYAMQKMNKEQLLLKNDENKVTEHEVTEQVIWKQWK